MRYQDPYRAVKLATALILVLGSAPVLSQKIADGVFWVYFKDKANNGYETTHPEAFLSSRSVGRRAWQGLAIDQTDLPVTQAYVDEIRGMGIAVKHISRWLNGIAMVGMDQTQFQAVLQKPFTDTIPWIPGEGTRYFPGKPEGSRFQPPPGHPTAYQYGVATEQIRQLDMDFLHAQGYTGSGVWIGLLDASFRNADTLPSFESMFAEGRLLGTRNFVNDSSVYRMVNSHGMYVLSICGAGWDGYMVGTAPGASYFLCTTENVFQETRLEEIAWVEGAEFLDSLGIDVINSSLGYSDFQGTAYDYTYQDMDGKTTFVSRAASLCASKGIVASISAGNEGRAEWYRITAPSDAFDILSVGAVDSTGRITAFSSRGPSFDGRLNPCVVAMGGGTGIQSTNGFLGRGSGTSFSSPLMAGSAASLWQAFPEVPARDLIFRIRQSGNRLSSPDATYGYGIPSFKHAYWLVSGTTDATAHMKLGIYPNPALGRVMIALPGALSGNSRIKMYDISGRMVAREQLSLPGEWTLPEPLSPGIYLITVETPFGAFRNTLVKE